MSAGKTAPYSGCKSQTAPLVTFFFRVIGQAHGSQARRPERRGPFKWTRPRGRDRLPGRPLVRWETEPL